MKLLLSGVKKEACFHEKIFTFEENISRKLKEKIKTRFELFQLAHMAAPIHIILGEIIINGIKATHKKIYYKHVVTLLEKISHRDKIAYEDWLALFKEEIERNGYKNLKKMAVKENKGVNLICKVNSNGFFFILVNPGAPSKVEMERIQRTILIARDASDLSYIFEDSEEQKEGAGLGLGLIVMTLKKLNLSDDCFHIETQKNKTIASLHLPWKFFKKKLVPVHRTIK